MVKLLGEWQLFLHGTPYEWQTTGNGVTQVLINGIDQTANIIASQLGLLNSKGMENFVLMQVSGVQDLEDYMHVVSTLQHLTSVVKVSVSDTTNDMLLLKIKIASGLEDLADVLKFVFHSVVEMTPLPAGLDRQLYFIDGKQVHRARKASINDA